MQNEKHKFYIYFLKNLFIFIHFKQMGYNLFRWLYMVQSRTICVITPIHRKIMSVSICYFSFSHLFHPSFLYTIHPSSTLASLPSPIRYLSLLIREIIQPLLFLDCLISPSMIFSIFTICLQMP